MDKNTGQKEKILVIRFSSFGDVVQTLSVPSALKKQWPDAEIHWATRYEFAPLISHHPMMRQVWGLDKKKGARGLLDLALALRQTPFDRIYDAHNNLRSLTLCFFLRWFAFLDSRPQPRILTRSLRRWKRFLLFRFRINRFEQPFSGQRDLLEPLETWGISKSPPPAPQLYLSTTVKTRVKELLQALDVFPFVALAPSAAFPLKRWPLDHWKELLTLWLKKQPTQKFVLLGGPEDVFLNELKELAPEQIHLFAGQLSLEESAQVIAHSQLLIANDTGLLHVGEQLGHPTVALMGPAPFGFPCRRETTRILELALDCRPCSKHGQGPCTHVQHQWCLRGIQPDFVFKSALSQIQGHPRPEPIHPS